jgi:hypothetical protein
MSQNFRPQVVMGIIILVLALALIILMFIPKPLPPIQTSPGDGQFPYSQPTSQYSDILISGYQ